MDLAVLPVNRETGECLELTPSILKELENDDLANLTASLKIFEKLKKEAEKEIKARLDKGQKFIRVSYPEKPIYTKTLVLDDEGKKSLIRNYGLDSVEPLSVKKLEDKYGNGIYEKLQPFIIETPKAKAIKWDV